MSFLDVNPKEKMYVYPIRQRVASPVGDSFFDLKPTLPKDFRLKKISFVSDAAPGTVLLSIYNKLINFGWGMGFIQQLNQTFNGHLFGGLFAPQAGINIPEFSKDYAKPYLLKKGSFLDITVHNWGMAPANVDLCLAGTLIDEKDKDEKYSEPFWYYIQIQAINPGITNEFKYNIPNYECLLECLVCWYVSLILVPNDLYINIYDQQQGTYFWEQDQNIRNICVNTFSNNLSWTSRKMEKNGLYTLKVVNRGAAPSSPFMIAFKHRVFYE